MKQLINWKKINQFLLAFTAMGSTFAAIATMSINNTALKYINLDNFDVDGYERKISYEDIPQSTFRILKDSETIYQVPFGSKLPDSQFYTKEEKYNATQLILDGPTRTLFDQSFNEECFYGLANFNQTNKFNIDKIKHLKTLTPEQKLALKNKDFAHNTKPTKDDSQAFVNEYKEAYDHNIKSLVLTGFPHINPVENFVRTQNIETKKMGFVLVDGAVVSEAAKYVASIEFRSDQSAFLTALATCQYLSIDNFDYYHQLGDLAVGVYGGLPFSAVVSYMGGYLHGINFFNKKILPLIALKNAWDEKEKNEHLVNVISLGERDSYFSGSFAQGDSTNIVKALLAKGAMAILPVAAIQVLDAIKEIKNQKSSAIVVGFDNQMEYSSFNEVSAFKDAKGIIDDQLKDKIIKFSAIKNMSYIISIIECLASYGIEKYHEDNNPTKELLYGSYGYETIGSFFNNGVTVSESAFHLILNLTNHTRSDSEKINNLEDLKAFLKSVEGQKWFEQVKKTPKFIY